MNMKHIKYITDIASLPASIQSNITKMVRVGIGVGGVGRRCYMILPIYQFSPVESPNSKSIEFEKVLKFFSELNS